MFAKQPCGHSIQKVCIWAVRVYLTRETYSSYHCLPSVHCPSLGLGVLVLPNLRNSILIMQLYLLPAYYSIYWAFLFTSSHPILLPCWFSNRAPTLIKTSLFCEASSEKNMTKKSCNPKRINMFALHSDFLHLFIFIKLILLFIYFGRLCIK